MDQSLSGREPKMANCRDCGIIVVDPNYVDAQGQGLCEGCIDALVSQKNADDAADMAEQLDAEEANLSMYW
jgi:hypothetical protein